ncbi:LysR substrate-binding domain-containing protein [Nitratidesulfovibrio termitidis]|uniref:LysR substrate-binding domain-containing protein n=1 Tax=Nitratidesulfovibrio termitidis TaxID=42252 RepID=UPI001FDED273|nr:LysR substrate-binding domain-containing protein [Nitratidesulfovibrio termitidis]
MRWLMPRLEAFGRIAPRVDVQLSTAGGPIDLSAQGVHLAIRRSDFTWPRGYACRSLGKERIGPVCSPGYWSDNANRPARLLHTRTRPQAWADWRALSGVALLADTEQFFDHFYFSLQAATAGMGLAMGPEPLVRDDIARGLLVAPYGFSTTPMEYVVLCPPTGDEYGFTANFTEWLAVELALPQD